MVACRTCANEIVNDPGKKGRPKTLFCSYGCKEAWHLAQDKARRAEARRGRTCIVCGGPITATTLKAITCSRGCGVAWQNRKRQEAKLARWEREKKPCAFCGGVIGPERRRNTAYCSWQCKHNAMSARWREKSPLYMRQYLYGITPEQYESLLASQGGRCAICRTDAPGGKGGWHVDHDHKTGATRGLLCHACNVALGNFGDNPERLRAALVYLAGRRGATPP